MHYYSRTIVEFDTSALTLTVAELTNAVSPVTGIADARFEIVFVLNGATNEFGMPQVALTGPDGAHIPDATVSDIFSLGFFDETFVFTLNTNDGSTLELLQLRAGDVSTFVILGGTYQGFPGDAEALNAFLSDLDPGTPAVSATDATTFTLTDFPAFTPDTGRFKDIPGRDSNVTLSDGGVIAYLGDGLDYCESGDGDDWISADGFNASGDYLGQYISGGAGNDTLKFVGDGSGTLIGGDGDDRLFGGDFADILNGGKISGSDLDGVVGDDVLFGGGGDDVLLDFSDGNDLMYGGDGNDLFRAHSTGGTLRGNEGNDRFEAWGDDDGTYRLFGDGGDDVFSLASGTGTAFGGDGDDIFEVETFNSCKVWGGAGADTFLFYRDGIPRHSKDFEPGVDSIGSLSISEEIDFESLTITQKDWGTRIDYEIDPAVIFLTGVTATDLTAADFI